MLANVPEVFFFGGGQVFLRVCLSLADNISEASEPVCDFHPQPLIYLANTSNSAGSHSTCRWLSKYSRDDQSRGGTCCCFLRISEAWKGKVQLLLLWRNYFLFIMTPRKRVITDFIGHWRAEPKEPPGLKGTSSWWCTRGCERCIPAFQQRYWVLPRGWSSDWAAPTLSGQEMVSMRRLHPNCLPSPGISSNSQCPHWKHRMMLFELIRQSLVICSCLLVRKEDWVHHEALHHSRNKEVLYFLEYYWEF